MAKNKIQQLASTAVLCLLIICSLHFVGRILEQKESFGYFTSYFQPDYDYDVLMIGASHVRSGFYPMELWDEYGIRAYNLASNGAAIPVTYWMLRNALDYHTPQAVVMDTCNMWSGRPVDHYWGYTQMAFDSFPLSVNKIRMVLDLLKDRELKDRDGENLYERRWDLIWNFRAYHSRWNELSQGDFQTREELENSSRIWKGAQPIAVQCPRAVPEETDDSEEIQYDSLARDYVERTIQFCQEKGIRLILIDTGYDRSPEAKNFSESLPALAEQYGIPFYDFAADPVIRFETDLSTSGYNTHVNIAGAIRQTAYLGEILSDELQLSGPGRDYELWQKDLADYEIAKADMMRSQSDPYRYAMFFTDPDYRTIIQVCDAEGADSPEAEAAFAYLEIGKESMPEAPFWAVPSGDQGYTCVPYTPGKAQEISLPDGTLSYSLQDGKETLLLDGDAVYQEEENASVRMIVYNEETREIVDVRTIP